MVCLTDLSSRLTTDEAGDTVTKREVEDFFKQHGNGNIVEVKLMNGFGFIQYDNEDDPKDIVPGEGSSVGVLREYGANDTVISVFVL